jgi:hypothetical protein
MAMDEAQLRAARRAKEQFTASIPAGIDVVGVGIGISGSNPALKVNLGSAPADKSNLPTIIEGIPVIYDVVGKIKSR